MVSAVAFSGLLSFSSFEYCSFQLTHRLLSEIKLTRSEFTQSTRIELSYSIYWNHRNSQLLLLSLPSSPIRDCIPIVFTSSEIEIFEPTHKMLLFSVVVHFSLKHQKKVENSHKFVVAMGFFS